VKANPFFYLDYFGQMSIKGKCMEIMRMGPFLKIVPFNSMPKISTS